MEISDTIIYKLSKIGNWFKKKTCGERVNINFKVLISSLNLIKKSFLAKNYRISEIALKNSVFRCQTWYPTHNTQYTDHYTQNTQLCKIQNYKKQTLVTKPSYILEV